MLQVKDVAWDELCGANQLDALLARHFASQFASKQGLPLRSVMGNPRTTAKLMKQVRVYLRVRTCMHVCVRVRAYRYVCAFAHTHTHTHTGAPQLAVQLH